MEELDIENALELYESLPVSSKASDLYFDKVILNENKAGDALKKVLEFFKKKNDVNTTIKIMTDSLDGMINCINMSPYSDAKQKETDLAVINNYKANISKIATRLTEVNAQMDELQKTVSAAPVNAEDEKDGEETKPETTDTPEETPSETPEEGSDKPETDAD